jgi:hypothetical protein
MQIREIYKLASHFHKVCLGQGVAGKGWILDCFFGCFGNRYNLFYDYFQVTNMEESEVVGEVPVRDLYGAEVRFRFLDKTKDEPDNVINTVKTCLKTNSPLGPFIHLIDVKHQYGYVYEVWIVFKPTIGQIEL